MKALHNAKLITISMLIAIGLSACDNPGTAERAGKKIDNTTAPAATLNSSICGHIKFPQ